MTKSILKLVAPVVVIGALMSSPAATAPMASSMAMKNAAEPLTEQVHWRGRRGGAGWALGGFAVGALIGSALAARPYYGAPYYGSPYYGAGYYGGYSYYPRPYYPSYAVYPPAPAYYGGGYGGGVEYCMRRFRTYNPNTGTYIAKGGRVRYCP